MSQKCHFDEVKDIAEDEVMCIFLIFRLRINGNKRKINCWNIFVHMYRYEILNQYYTGTGASIRGRINTITQMCRKF